MTSAGSCQRHFSVNYIEIVKPFLLKFISANFVQFDNCLALAGNSIAGTKLQAIPCEWVCERGREWERCVLRDQRMKSPKFQGKLNVMTLILCVIRGDFHATHQTTSIAYRYDIKLHYFPTISINVNCIVFALCVCVSVSWNNFIRQRRWICWRRFCLHFEWIRRGLTEYNKV